MSTLPTTGTLVCPSCSSDRLGHLETVTIRYRVRATICLQTGRRYEYLTDYDAERFDESAEPHQITPFQCLDCDEEYELGELDVPDSITGQIAGWA